MVKLVNDRIAKWQPATVVESLNNRSYIVQNKKKNIVRRNRVDLQETASSTPSVESKPEAISTDVRGFQMRRTRVQGTRSGDGQATRTAEVPEKRTSLGRVSKTPAYLRDYTTLNYESLVFTRTGWSTIFNEIAITNYINTVFKSNPVIDLHSNV